MKYITAGSTVQLNFEYTLNGSYVTPTSPALKLYNSAGTLQRTVGITNATETGKYSIGLTTADLSVGTYNAWAYGTYNGANIFSTSPELFEVLDISGEVYYATVTDLRDYLSITGAGQDSRLKEYITAASRYIDDYCRRKFRQYTKTYRAYHENPRAIMLPEYPVISVAGITVEVVGRTTNTEGVTDDTYYIDYNYGRIQFFKNFVGKFTITYTAGVVSVPAPVRLACLKICSFYYNKRKREGIKHESLLSHSYTLSPDIQEEIKSLLDPYKLISM